MWKFLRGGATIIPGGTFIPESRVLIWLKFKLIETEISPCIYLPDLSQIHL